MQKVSEVNDNPCAFLGLAAGHMIQRPWTVLLLVAGLAGCVAGDPMTRQEMRAIEAYYDWHAAEGPCNAPIMEGVTRSDIVSQNDDRTVKQVRYLYRDYIRRSTRNRRCRGFGSRTFTLTYDEGRPRVIGMSGQTRR